MRTWFAVYAIPPAASPAYRLGSAVLGYDIRRARPADPARDAPLPEIDPRWTDEARGFGFHVTLVEAYAVDSDGPDAAAARLDEIAAETRDLLTALHPASRFALVPQGLARWRDGEVWVLRYAASRPLDILQAVLATRLAVHADHSLFVDEDRDHPDRYPEPYQRARMRRLLTPRGLDSWRPHATLLNPYDGPPAPELAARLEGAFGIGGAGGSATGDAGGDRAGATAGDAAGNIWEVDRLALVTRADPDDRWTIAREFRLPGGELVADE